MGVQARACRQSSLGWLMTGVIVLLSTETMADAGGGHRIRSCPGALPRRWTPMHRHDSSSWVIQGKPSPSSPRSLFCFRFITIKQNILYVLGQRIK